jgi:hypothetical protein
MATTDMANVVASQMVGIANMMSAMAYLAGCAFGIKAAFSFKEHNENPEKVRLSQPVTMMMMAAALLALPTFLTSANEGALGVASATRPASQKDQPTKAVEPALVAKDDAADVAYQAPAPSAPASKDGSTAQMQIKPVNPNSNDFSALMEVLGGLGLLAMGGWVMLARSLRKGKAAREEQLELALTKSEKIGQLE